MDAGPTSRGEAAVHPAAAARQTAPVAALPPSFAAPAVAAVLACLGWALQWRGGDLPAQLHRVALVARDGFVLWDASWFGGHLTPGYSVVYPLLAARFGVWPVAVASAAAAAWAFDALVRRHAPTAGLAPGLWFAAGTVVNLAVGRMTFALGLAVGLLAVLAASHRRFALAAVLSVLTPLTSPVAGAFLALAWTAHAISARRPRVLALAVLAAAPVGATTLLFPHGGDFPFGAGALVLTLVASGLVAWRSSRTPVVRVGALLYAATALVAFAVHSPLGANVTRLGMFLAWPLLLAAQRVESPTLRWRDLPARLADSGWPASPAEVAHRILRSPAGRAAVVLAAAPVLLAWQWTPAIDGMVRAGADPSTQVEFHQPLLRFLHQQTAEPFRVEVVPLARHGEATYVANEFLLARGWDRQLDRLHNGLFYDGTLTAATYRAWLLDAGVRFVALADADLDGSGTAEAALLKEGVPGLTQVLVTPEWTVWRVDGATDLVAGPARLLAVSSDLVALDASGSGSVLVKVRADGRWTVTGPACLLEPSTDGWLRLQVHGPGVVDLRPAGIELGGPGCDVPDGALTSP